jgi:hypothetical protein
MPGNRRSENNPEGAGGSAAESPSGRGLSVEPRISSQGLQFAGFTPIQPMPSIKEAMARTQQVVQQVQTPPQPAVEAQNVVAAQPVPNVETQNVVSPQPAPNVETPLITSLQPETTNVGETQNVASPQPETTDGVETQNVASPQPHVETRLIASLQPETTDGGETQNVASPQQTTDEPETQTTAETFEDCWGKMVDAIFKKKPAFYHQLRDYIPRYENDVIYVDVENDFQKNQLEMSKRAMLEFWRDQFKLNVDEIEFVIHEHEKKKVIYTSEDKVENMLEQNPELKDFLQVLNFRIKD